MIAPVVKELVHAFISETEAGALRAHLDKTLEGPVFDDCARPPLRHVNRAQGALGAPFEVCANRYPNLVLRLTETTRYTENGRT